MYELVAQARGSNTLVLSSAPQDVAVTAAQLPAGTNLVLPPAAMLPAGQQGQQQPLGLVTFNAAGEMVLN